MSLIACPECAREVSDKALVCPGCGVSIARVLQSTAHDAVFGAEWVSTPSASKPTKPNFSLIFWAVLILLIVGSIYYYESPTYREQNLVPLPIDVRMRSALIGPGQVALITNYSDRYLSLRATFKNPTLNLEKTFRIDIAPRTQTEFGHLEGWAFSSGDMAVFSHNNYKSWSRTFP